MEWTLAEYGCLAYGLVTAPLFDSLGYEACAQLIEFCGIEVVVCDGDDHVDALLGHGQLPKTLRTIITVDQLPVERVIDLDNHGVKFFTMDDVEKLGRSNPVPVCPSEPDQLATLLFTSGTTGMAKAVMITHRQFVLFLKSMTQSMLPAKMTPEDSTLGFLPLAHIAERFIEKLIHVHGGKVGYISGDIRNPKVLYADAKEVQPTYFFFVPRIMTRIHNEIQADLNRNIFKRIAAALGILCKTVEMQWGIFRNDSFWDRWLFHKYQAMLGGKVRISQTGSAPTDGKVLNFMRAAFGCYVAENYGQTESCGPFTGTVYGDLAADQVGIPFPDTEIKLVDVPKMGYRAADGKGELCARADFLMKGYFKMEDKTAKTIDQDGWLHTGDIGMWLPDGNLRIFDRKKHVFKLSQGEYLAPERLEGAFSRSDLISNIFIDGDSKYPYCVALIYPKYDAMKAGKIKSENKQATEAVKKQLIDELTRIGHDRHMKSYEIPKKIHILDEGFSMENGCLTPSNKTKREHIRTKFKKEIAQLYAGD
ncbi:long-chain-fatty-acid--CoA ligase 1-like [Paramacrobiotus metropolitanus]|uniref:long-chain-fatty-acid--CoA ligase 1-like n=1 Tax=Paramacrobiotus metropolitanus TaxID=2943436 RepID=UPI0024460846|nr:long-chain-fatty-acid--CoA ligase 1-like [Paramacrobiotus metropolitanus]